MEDYDDNGRWRAGEPIDFDKVRAETQALASLNRTIRGYGGEIRRIYSGSVDVEFPNVHSASSWARTFGMNETARFLTPVTVLGGSVLLHFTIMAYAERLDLFVTAAIGA